MRRIPSRLVILLAVGAVLVVLNMVWIPPRVGKRVDLERVEKKPMSLVVRAPGTLEPKDSHTIKAQFDGPLIEKNFREGQTVKKGDVLAVIGREKIQLDHQAKLNDLKNAKSDLIRARKDLRVQKQLFRQEAVAYSTVEDAERTAVKASQALRSAEEAYRLSEEQWQSANVVSPIDGTIVKDWVAEEKSVAAAKEIVTVADVSQYTVKARVDELDIKRVHEGQPADVTLPVYDQKTLSAEVQEVGSQVEGSGLTEIPVVLLVTDSKGLSLRPKLSAEARIHVGTTEPIFSVPSSAVANADGTSRVWVMNAFHRIHSVIVELGRTSPERVEVKRGLREGQWICSQAEPGLANGMKILINRWESAISESNPAVSGKTKPNGRRPLERNPGNRPGSP